MWLSTALVKVRHRLECAGYAVRGYPVVSLGDESSPRRALLAYLSTGLAWRAGDVRFRWHQNVGQSRSIALLLAQRGYRVDVVQYDDARFVPGPRYDLVIAHPGRVSQRILAAGGGGRRVCLRTGRHAAFVDREAGRRYADLRKRRACLMEWPGMGETDDVYRGFDAIACFDGDGGASETFREVGLPVYPFRNYANPDIAFVERDWQAARLGYVYMANGWPVLKGLDWLLDIFSQTPERHLYIAGRLPGEFKALYAGELRRPNIHVLGHVELAGRRFVELGRKAAWYVSPSASEGCQGAALDWMAAGMVPVISKVCGVEVGETGIVLRECTPERFKAALDEGCRLETPEVESRARKARELVVSRYTPSGFEVDWKHVLERMDC